MKPRHAWLVYGCLLFCGCATVSLSGCATGAVRSQSPEDIEALGADIRLIGDVAVPFGMHPIKIQAVGLVTGLDGTGSDPDPSPHRAMLVSEMQTRGVRNPDNVLAEPSTALVIARAILRPGIQKGDHFDVEVVVPSHGGAANLRAGWLMESRLREHAILGNQLREGDMLGLCQGPVLVDPSALTDDSRLGGGRGRILRGGVATKSRIMGLVLKPDYQSVRYSAQIQTAVNRRFHTFSRGIKKGVANAKDNEYIDLTVHQRYKDNVGRYLQVIRSLPLRETQTERVSRISLLERQMLDPLVSASAALRLEALGRDGIATLKKGIASTNAEVRFYSAEALAYLDESEAAKPLAQAARDEPAFRMYAFTALSAMDDVAAYDALCELLHVPSAETRYGAFRALWAMNSRDPLVRGEDLADQFSYHVIDSSGPPMIHVTRNYRAEVVLFGAQQQLTPPFAIDAGRQIMVKSSGQDRVTVSKFSTREPDQKRVVSTSIDEVVRAIVELGGTYPDVVQVLQQAKKAGALASRFEVDALPTSGRRYQRGGNSETEGELEDEAVFASGDYVVTNPLPDLYLQRASDAKPGRSTPDDEGVTSEEEEEKNSRPFGGLFGRIWGREDN